MYAKTFFVPFHVIRSLESAGADAKQSTAAYAGAAAQEKHATSPPTFIDQPSI
jgi:hypothetical protein